MKNKIKGGIILAVMAIAMAAQAEIIIQDFLSE